VIIKKGKNMIKNWIALIIASLMVISLVGCGNNKQNEEHAKAERQKANSDLAKAIADKDAENIKKIDATPLLHPTGK
jgi:uncharacterized lipoprotein YehR (DUF1307 family)